MQRNGKKRNILIKDSCEQCGSKEGLTLQHTWHPREYSIIKRETCSKYGELINKEYSVDSLVKEDEVLKYFSENIKQENRDVCPQCGSFSITPRKNLLPRYRCNHCKNQFENPINMIIPEFVDDRKIKPQHEMNIITYSGISWTIYKDKCKKLLFLKYGDLIEKETILTVIDEYIRYLSLKDTITLCKKCAFLCDIKGKNLCPVCKTNYKFIGMDMCYQCRNKRI